MPQPASKPLAPHPLPPDRADTAGETGSLTSNVTFSSVTGSSTTSVLLSSTESVCSGSDSG